MTFIDAATPKYGRLKAGVIEAALIDLILSLNVCRMLSFHPADLGVDPAPL
jgi:hypothetical protein